MTLRHITGRVAALAAPLLAAAALTACNDMLTETPRSQIVTETYFTSAADARAAIAATYRPLSTGSLWGTNLQWGLIAAGDEARVGPEEENANIVSLTQLRWTSTNPYTSGAWTGLYQMITRANLVLEKVPGITMDETQKGQIVGEAKFLRALGYHYLVRLYGDVPLVTTSDEQLASTSGARTPAAQVYAQIVKDATEAEAALPASWPASEKGRAPKAAAQALLAEHYIWTKQWANASANTQKIIASNTYALVPNYIQAFLPGSQNRSEEIFAAQSSSANGAPAIDIAAWSYPRNMNPNSAGGWGTYQPLQWFIDSYQAGDYRREASFFTAGRLSTGQEVTFLPHVFKYRPSQRPGANQDVNWPIFRYADVLLMHAEALNEQGQTAQAIGFVNQVRARARNGAGSESRAQPADLPTSLGQADAREAIFQERMWELAFEGKRWFDLVRRGWDYFRAALSKDPTATDVQQTDMLWPIPQGQIDINPALTQNPGY
jgi:starch-binding outer membrane protein, SusD/RagB family